VIHLVIYLYIPIPINSLNQPNWRYQFQLEHFEALRARAAPKRGSLGGGRLQMMMSKAVSGVSAKHHDASRFIPSIFLGCLLALHYWGIAIATNVKKSRIKTRQESQSLQIALQQTSEMTVTAAVLDVKRSLDYLEILYNPWIKK